MIDPATAIEAAKRGLDQLDANNTPAISAAYATGHAGKPALVARLDTAGQSYYLVPWQDEHGITLMIQVDAQNSTMSSLAVISPPSSSMMLSTETALHMASEQLGSNSLGEATLVWKACRETSSPFLPLYQIAFEDGHVFVSMSGGVFRQLTPFINGG